MPSTMCKFGPSIMKANVGNEAIRWKIKMLTREKIEQINKDSGQPPPAESVHDTKYKFPVFGNHSRVIPVIPQIYRKVSALAFMEST